MSTSDLPEELKVIPQTIDSPDNRMPALVEEDLSDAQKAAIAMFEAQRGRSIGGPFIPLLRSPKVFEIAIQMGYYLRYETDLPPKLTELAILITARRWSQNYEWHAHRLIGEKIGLSPAIIEAIREGRRPQGMSDDEERVYDYCTELHRNGQVSDFTYDRMQERFGDQAIIEFSTICGHYSLLAMVMNAVRTPLPVGAEKELEGFPG
ncbi:MAG: carboxymuconolactone decarboxylase family protein [Hyphomicrobiaceae bacterium]